MALAGRHVSTLMLLYDSSICLLVSARRPCVVEASFMGCRLVQVHGPVVYVREGACDMRSRAGFAVSLSQTLPCSPSWNCQFVEAEFCRGCHARPDG